MKLQAILGCLCFVAFVHGNNKTGAKVLVQSRRLHPHKPSPCKDGFSLHGDQCYRVIREKIIYEYAAMACGEIGSFLAEPRSQEENDAVQTMMADIDGGDSDVWLGATNTATDPGAWKWGTDGAAVSGDHWAKGFPNQPDTEHCLFTMHKPSGTNGWNDADCSWKFYPLCQTPPIHAPAVKEISVEKCKRVKVTKKTREFVFDDVITRVRLYQRRRGAECNECDNYGHEGNKFWAYHECRAKFIVCTGGKVKDRCPKTCKAMKRRSMTDFTDKCMSPKPWWREEYCAVSCARVMAASNTLE